MSTETVRLVDATKALLKAIDDANTSRLSFWEARMLTTVHMPSVRAALADFEKAASGSATEAAVLLWKDRAERAEATCTTMTATIENLREELRLARMGAR